MADIYEVARRHRAALLQQEAEAAARMVEAYKTTWAGIDAALQRVLTQIAEAKARDETVNPAWLRRRDRLQTLQDQVAAELTRFAAYAGQEITNTQREAARRAQKDAQEQVQAAQVGAAWNRLPTEALSELVGVLGDGSPLKERFNEIATDGAKLIGDALLQSISLGRGARQTAREVQKAASVPLTQALTISRTETLRAYRESSIQGYAANPDVVMGWRWLATLTARSCAACIAMHGTIHPVTEPFGSHPNCRCVAAPVVIGYDKPFQTGADWLAEQESTLQDTVLGSLAAGRLYRAGEIALPAFVYKVESEKWGVTRTAASLKQAMLDKNVRLP